MAAWENKKIEIEGGRGMKREEKLENYIENGRNALEMHLFGL